VRELFLEDEALVVTGDGYSPEGAILSDGRPADPEAWETLGIALRIGALCSNSSLERRDDRTWRIVGDPTEGALLTLAAKGGIWREDLVGKHRPLAEFPFTAERRRMTVVVPARGGRPLALTKGSPTSCSRTVCTCAPHPGYARSPPRTGSASCGVARRWAAGRCTSSAWRIARTRSARKAGPSSGRWSGSASSACWTRRAPR